MCWTILQASSIVSINVLHYLNLYCRNPFRFLSASSLCVCFIAHLISQTNLIIALPFPYFLCIYHSRPKGVGRKTTANFIQKTVFSWLWWLFSAWITPPPSHPTQHWVWEPGRSVSRNQRPCKRTSFCFVVGTFFASENMCDSNYYNSHSFPKCGPGGRGGFCWHHVLASWKPVACFSIWSRPTVCKPLSELLIPW